DLLALGTDDEVADVGDAPAPLPVKDAEDLILRGELVVDARVDAVDRVLGGQRETEVARPGVGARRRRLRPDLQEPARNGADLIRRDPVERHQRCRARKADLLARAGTNTRGVESRRAQRRQIAGAKRRIRDDDAGDRTARVDADALVVAEEEQL